MVALIGKKMGMTQVFNDRAELVVTTMVHVSPNYVLEVRKAGAERKPTVRLASNATTAKHLSKAQQGVYAATGVPLQRDIVEFQDFDASCTVGDALTVSLFDDVGYIDAIGWSKGKGYQGVVRRYGFGGGRATHGSKFHREVGSTGMAAYPSKTLKNTRMAGRMPVKRVSVQNLRLVGVDVAKSVILVKGAIPGPTGRTVIIRSAIKRGDAVRS